MKCDVCGKEMTDENGQAFIGKSIEIIINKQGDDFKFIGEINPQEKGALTGYAFSVNIQTDSPSPDFIQKQLGEYKVNKRYKICWECWFKSLGMKP